MTSLKKKRIAKWFHGFICIRPRRCLNVFARIDDKICLSGPFVSRSLLYLPSLSLCYFSPRLLPSPRFLASNLSTLTKQLCAKELQITGRKKSRATMLLRFQLILIHQRARRPIVFQPRRISKRQAEYAPFR